MMSEQYLLDSSALIAFATPDHFFHDRVNSWFRKVTPVIVTCPITQGALVQMYMRTSEDGRIEGALSLLGQISTWEFHQFIPCDLDFFGLEFRGIIGHKQVTDAYLAHLAASKGLKLATLDRAQAALYPETAELIA